MLLRAAQGIRGYRPGDAFLSNPASLQRRGLIGNWTINGRTAGVIWDSSGLQHSGSLEGTFRYALGPALGGIVGFFDGTSTALSIPHRADLSLTQYSIAAWVNPDNFGGFRMILTKANALSRNYELDIEVTTGKLRLYHTSAPGVYQGFTGNTALTVNTWQHCAGTFDGATQALYLNGRADGTNATATTPETTADPVYIGRLNDAAPLYYSGFLTHVLVYNRALTAQEVWALYDPSTRWDLSAVPSRQMFVNISAAFDPALFASQASPFIYRLPPPEVIGY